MSGIELVRQWLNENYVPTLREHPVRTQSEIDWQRGAAWTVKQVLSMLDHAEREERIQQVLTLADIQAHEGGGH